MSKIVQPAKLPKEPVIRFVKIEEKPIEIEKKPPPPKQKPKKTETNKKEKTNLTGEKEGKIIPKKERKPVETPKGKEIKREIVKPEKKAIIPPKEKKLEKTKPEKKKKPEQKKPKPQPKKEIKKEVKPQKNVSTANKTQKKNIEVKEKKKPVLPPPPEKPELEIAKGNTLEPVKEPPVEDIGKTDLGDISGISDKDVNTSKILEGLQSIKPVNRKLSFGEPLSKFDKGVEGTAAVRKIEYMPPPPLIKTRLPAPPRNIKVKIWIAPDGSVQKAQLLKRTGDPLLDKAILSYIYSWKFNSIDKNEVQWAIVNIKFKPQ
jgi:TonB family protein